MKRCLLQIALIVVLIGLTLLADNNAYAQNRTRELNKPYQIYVITYRGRTAIERGFEEYFKSRKIPVEITWRDVNLDTTRLPALVQEIRAVKPDLVYTFGTSVTLGVVGAHDAVDPKRHIVDIPVVFTLVAAPVLAKIVPDLKSSGRNVTGVSHVAPTETQFRAMASYRPFKQVGILYTPTERNSVVLLDEIRQLGRQMGFTTVERKFHLDASGKVTGDGAAELIREIKRGKADWLYLPPDSFVGTQAQHVIIPAALASGLPTFASTEQLMESGALSGLVSPYYMVGQFTAHKARQILVDHVPAREVAVETLKRFSFQVRMEAAHKLKLPPPLSLFNYAEIIASDGPRTASAQEGAIASSGGTED
jgi:putative tryptophan/tyrosine transport system substrate-binding protein